MRHWGLELLLALALAGCREGPVLNIDDAEPLQGAGIGVLKFRVTLSEARSQPVTVHYSTQDGTAKADLHYRPASGTLSFPSNSRAAQAFEVTILSNAANAAKKTLTATLSDAVNASIGRRRASAAIPPPTGRASGPS